MKFNPEIHHRHSIRLKDYDYSQEGAYFVTICTWNKDHMFGEIDSGNMSLNEYGEIVKQEWLRTGIIRANVKMDYFIIMPNHFHGILMISDDCRGTLQRARHENIRGESRGTLQRAPASEQFGKPVSNSIPTIVRLFKSTTTKQINQIRNLPGISVWQRNYYEHIIRSEPELNKIREYILNNPLNWETDENFKN